MALTLSIDAESSPRIITVLAPDTAITMQELVDLLRDWEDELDDLEYDKLIDAYGKQELGGGILVGVTVQLLNAKLAFEARGGPTFVQCNVTGGNLVALDEDGNTMSVILPTAYTQVILTSSSSATLQELETIQYSSYAGAVHIDVASGETGIAYPVGTEEHPVDNLTDALAIAANVGLSELSFHSDYTFPNGTYITCMILSGQGMEVTTLTFQPLSIVLNCGVKNTKVVGYISGVSFLEDCYLYNFYGFTPIPAVQPIIARHCMIGGTVGLPALFSGTMTVVSCWSGAENGSLVIFDMGGSTASVFVKGFMGSVELRNNTQANIIVLDMNSGLVRIHSSCTTGTIRVRGVGVVENSGGPGVTLETTGLVNKQDIWSLDETAITASGSIGKKVKDNLDTTISSRATPGDLMGLTPSAITAETLTEDAVEEIQLGLARPGDQMDLIANAIDDTKIAANARRYQSKVWMTDDDTGNADRYIVIFFKDSQPTTTGITVPKIQVIKISDGTDLVPLTTLTQIGALGLYKHEEATRRMLSGHGYIIKVTATIDAATRTWFQPMSRDS